MSTILPAEAHTIAVLSQKGGTGKTTLVRSLTYVLRRVGMEVLAIDLDPQGNLSDSSEMLSRPSGSCSWARRASATRSTRE